MAGAPAVRSRADDAPYFSIVVAGFPTSFLLTHPLRSASEQTFRDYEIIVVDDALTEDVRAAVAAIAPQARLIRLDRRQGITAARNAGLAAATGRYVAFLDGMDVWHPSYLRFQHAATQAVPNALFSFSDYFLYGPGRCAPMRQLMPEPLADNALLHMVMQPFVQTMSCFVAPRADLLAAEGFDVNLNRYAELDLCVRLLAGRPGRKSLACLTRPAPSIPQVLAVRKIAVDHTALGDEIAEWEEERDDYIDQLFGRQFMAPFAELRQVCRKRLAESQRAYFTDCFGAESIAAAYSAPAIDALRPGDLARGAPAVGGTEGRVGMFHPGRCGSTVLGDLLGQNSRVFWDSEVFDPTVRKLPKNPFAYLQRRIERCGKPIYGFETKLYHPERLGYDTSHYLEQLEGLGFERFIFLTRRNVLRLLVSAWMAMAKAEAYHVAAGAKSSLKRIRLDPLKAELGGVFAPLVDHLRATAALIADARQVLDGRYVLDLIYEEDVAEDPRRAYLRACEFLGIEPEPAQVSYGRTTPFPISEVIENFDEVKAALAGSEFEWMLAE